MIPCKLLILLFFSISLISCSVCEWVSSPPYPHDPKDIWQTVYQVINKRYNIKEASETTYKLETDWRNQMSLQYLEGFRDKVYIKIEPSLDVYDPSDTSKPLDIKNEKIDTRPKHIIKICVMREQNRNMDNPNVISEAEWYTAGNNFDEANLLLSFFAMRLAVKMPPPKEIETQETPKTKTIEEFMIPEK